MEVVKVSYDDYVQVNEVFQGRLTDSVNVIILERLLEGPTFALNDSAVKGTQKE